MTIHEIENVEEKKKKGRKPKVNNYFDERKKYMP